MRTWRASLLALVLVVLGSGCAVITQDQVGVKRTFGQLQDETLQPGFYFLNPITTTMLRLPTHTQNLKITLDLPSQEGVSVSSEISILYRINSQRAHEVLRNAGPEYEETLILSIFRSAAADVCAQFMAKDMHSGERSKIENAIRDRMMTIVGERGFVIEAVLLKSISLPAGLARSIEARLESEQDALRMKFVLERERQEAERKLLAAQGERDAQKVLAEGLTDEILKLRAIEAFMALAVSPNTKVIITNGAMPMVMDDNDEPAPVVTPNQ